MWDINSPDGKHNPCGARYNKASLADCRLPQEGIEKLVKWIKKKRNFFVFLGNPGCGKTHTCAAVYNYIKKTMSRHLRYWNERKLLEEIRSQMDLTGSYLEKMRYLTDDDFLILDDIGSSGINDWRKEVLFDFLDSRYETGLPTFLTSNLKRKEIREGFGERFESRLFASENTIYELNGPDWRQSMDQS